MTVEAATQRGTGRPADDRGAFLITVDTEGDNLWSKPREITVTNIASLPRFQRLCEAYHLKPTYLTNWEMATSDAFVEFGRDVLARGAGEVGMHLHAWNSPPVVALTDDDYRHQPYLIEYAEHQIREKVVTMTDVLESTFGVKMVSHRAGRWGLDERYARILVEAGYRVDCSVTPHWAWAASRGDPAGVGGPDYRHFPDVAYFMDPDDISRAGSSPLLQVPVTILPVYESLWARSLRGSVGRIPYVRRSVYKAMPDYSWLHPVGNSADRLIRILSLAQESGRDYVEFMVHSSELMAGGAPWLATQNDIDVVFDRMESLFDAAQKHWQGRTLNEFRDGYAEARMPLQRRGRSSTPTVAEPRLP